MPIIDKRTKPEAEPEAPPAGIVPKSGANRPAAAQPSRQTASSSGGGGAGKAVGIVLAVIIGVGVLGSGGWYLSENGLPEMPTEPSHDYDDQTVALDIERAFRTKGLISLLERKIGQNERALSQASKSNDQVISDTMRLALAKNLEDLDKHQKAYIETLVALDEAHAADADRLKAALKETLAAKDSSYKVGQAETIREIVDVLENKPVDKPFRDYLTSRFRPQKEQDLENNG